MSELKFKVIKGKKRVAIVAFLGVKILTNGLSDLKKLIYKYGITKTDYEEMLLKQDGKCAICGTTNSRHNKSNNLLVDHCHDSLKVRGLLCNRCNTTLGLVNDDVSTLKKMIDYLK